MKLKENHKNSIWGFIIGDCLGVPYEFTSKNNIRSLKMLGYGAHYQAAGTWSDDTSMLLSTLDCDFLNIRELKYNLVKVLRGEYSIDGHLFDIGHSTKLNLLGITLHGDYQDGNGSMMRILPYAFVEEVDRLDDSIEHSSYLTHRSDIAAFCCIVYVKMVRAALSGYFNFMEILEKEYKNNTSFSLSEYPLDDKITYYGFVWHSLLCVIDILSKAKSYKDGVKMAINLGGDTDTHAALVGAILAIKYNDWKPFLNKVRGKDIINKIIGL